MNWIAVYVRFMSLCFLAGIIRAITLQAKEPMDFWTGIGIIIGCWVCAMFWTQANQLDIRK